MALPNEFASLTSANTVQLDDNFNACSTQGLITCRASGTSAAISLIQTTVGAQVTAYVNYMVFQFISVNANTGPMTANVSGLGALPIYLDALSGPVTLNGGEIVFGNFIWLAYDSSLNSGLGGFHLVNPYHS